MEKGHEQSGMGEVQNGCFCVRGRKRMQRVYMNMQKIRKLDRLQGGRRYRTEAEWQYGYETDKDDE